MTKPDPKAPPAAKGTAIRRCSCVNTFQDREYGHGMRVHNAMNNGWRCTSCGREEKIR